MTKMNISALNDLKKVVEEAAKQKKELDQIQEEAFTARTEIVKSIDVKMNIKSLKELKNIVGEVTQKNDPRIIEEEVIIPPPEAETPIVADSIEQVAKYLSPRSKSLLEGETTIAPEAIEAQRWNDPLRRDPNEKFVTFRELNDHYTLFLSRIQQQLSSLGGGGEVNFRYLDDVNRFTMQDGNNNHVLEYDAATGKVQFTANIGAIETILFDTEHVNDSGVTGLLSWNREDDTLNLNHPNGVVQQMGQEMFAYVRNRTGSVIPDGTIVRFAGAEQNGTSRLLVAPFLANGEFPNLYGLGITTQDIPDGEDGFVTVWGKIRRLNTAAFNVGDILYASPTIPGGLTNVKPTAPNNVLPIAAVLRKDATQGEIFVRPTIEQRYFYGSFSDNQNHVAALPNTPYAIPLNTVEFSSGVIQKVTDNAAKTKIQVLQSGLYNFQFSTQFVSTNSSAKDVYIWARKNGQDIPHSATRTSVVGNGVYFVASWNFIISMNANDWFELMWATTDVTASIVSPAATSFAPSTPSTLLSVTQVAQ